MILEKTKFNISKQLVNPQWELKNAKTLLTEMFDTFECLITQNPTTQDSRLS